MDFSGPIEALFPGAAGAVLDVLTRTEQRLSMRQIADRAGVSHPQVARHVERLERLGVVQREIVGRSHLVSLTDSVAARTLRGLASLDESVLRYMRNTAPSLQPDALSVVVFGSFARGEATEHSDLDVAVVVDGVVSEGWLEDLSRWVDDVAAFAGSPVSEIVVDVEELPARMDDPLWGAILAEGLTVAGRDLADIFGVLSRGGR
jgi:predicted nucleotidyltransferase